MLRHAIPRPFVACAAAALLLWAPLAPRAQDDRAKAEAQARRAAERLQALQREADKLASEERSLLGDLRRLEIDRQIKTENLKRVTAEAEAAQSQLASATDRINRLERQDAAERPDLRARLVEIYKLGRARYLRLLFATADLRQIGRASRMVAALAHLDQERVTAHQHTVDALKATRTEIEERNRRMQALRAEAERAERESAAAARAQSELIGDIDRRRDLNAQLTGELQAAQQKLQLTLRDLSAGAAGSDASVLPFRPFRGALDWPASGAVRRPPGQIGTAGGPASSAGIEIAAPRGAPVQAVHEGTVAYSDTFTGFGNLVILDHGAQSFSLYGDLQEILVKRGARVEQGQLLGRVGTTPAGAAGLYFELRIDGRPADPLQWLKKR